MEGGQETSCVVNGIRSCLVNLELVCRDQEFHRKKIQVKAGVKVLYMMQGGAGYSNRQDANDIHVHVIHNTRVA